MLRFARRLGAALAVVGCAAIAAAPAQATFPGANGKIVFSKGGDLWTINPDGTGLAQVTSGARTDSTPKWSPDGSMISFGAASGPTGDEWAHGYDGFDVYVRHADGSETKFGAASVDYYDHAWSPDGELLFSTERQAIDYGGPPGQSSNLVVANVDGSNEKVIVKSLFPPADPDWSPIGDRIALTLHYDGSVITFFDPDGTNRSGGPNGGGYPGDIPENLSPSWSPDATRIAYAGGGDPNGLCPGRCALTAKPDGTDLQRVSPDPNGHDGATAWSPDGSEIAYVHRSVWSDPDEIWLVNADGSNPHFLTNGTDPDWQPLIAPRHLDPPRVLGPPREGRGFAATRGLWLGTPTVAYAYQWALCDRDGQNCADISGATERVYTPTHDDVAHTLRVKVTATNDFGEGDGTSELSAPVGESLLGSPVGELLMGTAGSDLVSALGGPDRITLGGGNDIGRGGYGNDWVAGGDGSDFINGGPGRDRLRGGSGRDRIYARDGYRDWISCGPGRDLVRADHRDRVASNCELVKYG
jgi:Tol biopolymer transport system component